MVQRLPARATGRAVGGCEPPERVGVRPERSDGPPSSQDGARPERSDGPRRVGPEEAMGLKGDSSLGLGAKGVEPNGKESLRAARRASLRLANTGGEERRARGSDGPQRGFVTLGSAPRASSPMAKNPLRAARRASLRLANTGGEEGIRTPGTGLSPYNGLANRRLQPLGHLTARGLSSIRQCLNVRATCPWARRRPKVSLSASHGANRIGA
jgi:hypothetical protein